MRDLTKAECKAISRDECPICGQRKGFIIGPKGGASVNIFCPNCDAGFNITIAFDELVWGELIQEPKEGFERMRSLLRTLIERRKRGAP